MAAAQQRRGGLYLQPGVLPEGVQLTNATGAYGPAVSEHLLAMTLELMKKLHLYRDNQQDKLWRDEGTVTGIADAVFLVVGLGDIGQLLCPERSRAGWPRYRRAPARGGDAALRRAAGDGG